MGVCIILEKYGFTTSKTSQVVVSRVAQRFKVQDLRKYQEKVKIGWNFPSRNKTFVITVKNYAEAFIKVFCLVQFCLSSLLCSKYFFRDCRMQLKSRKISQFHLTTWCGNFVQTHSFCRVSGKSLGNCAFTQIHTPGNEVDYGILCNVKSYKLYI